MPDTDNEKQVLEGKECRSKNYKDDINWIQVLFCPEQILMEEMISSITCGQVW